MLFLFSEFSAPVALEIFVLFFSEVVSFFILLSEEFSDPTTETLTVSLFESEFSKLLPLKTTASITAPITTTAKTTVAISVIISPVFLLLFGALPAGAFFCEISIFSEPPKSISEEILKILAKAIILSIVGCVCPVSKRLILCLETPSFSANSS